MISAFALAACASNTINVDKSVISFDGLFLAEAVRFEQAYVRDPLDLSAYKRVMPLGTPSQFRYVPEDDAAESGHIELSDAQKADFQRRLSALVTQEVGRGQRYALTDAPGADVLTLWGTLVDVNAHRAPDGQEVGEFVMVIELRDSLSEETLVRAIHPYRVPFEHDNPSTNQANVDKTIVALAADIRTGLDELLGASDQRR